MARLVPTKLLIVLATCAGACGDDDRTTPLDARVIERDGSSPSCATPQSVPDHMPCTCNGDCMEGATCQTEEATGLPMGRCYRLCTPGEEAACAPGYACPEEYALSGVASCFVTCTSDADCPAASLCAGGLCFPHCSGDGDCRSGHCDLHTHQCTDGSPSTGAPNVAPCVRHDECRSGTCSPSAMRCVTNCSTVRQDCPEGELCMELEGGGTVGACFPECDTDADCAHLSVPCALGTTPDGSTVRVCG